jgi:hypothetical protein
MTGLPVLIIKKPFFVQRDGFAREISRVSNVKVTNPRRPQRYNKCNKAAKRTITQDNPNFTGS